MKIGVLAIPLLAFCTLCLSAKDDKVPTDFVPLFNGKDLTGWVNVNCAHSTFRAEDNEIVTNGRPTGFLRTAKQYENFILEMEWMHVNKTEVGNSGLFVWGDPLPAVGTGYTRGIEVQVLVNYETDWATSHGDLFSIWGAKCKPDRPHPKGYERCLPSERVCKGGGEWNHYKVVANNGSIKLSVNGKEVSGVSQCNPRKGYLALESEGAECHFRNIKIQELPSTNPKPEEIANVDEGFVSLFNGINLDGWSTKDQAWSAGEILKCVENQELVSLKKYITSYFILDYKLPTGTDSITLVHGDTKKDLTGKPGTWVRYRGNHKQHLPKPIIIEGVQGLELRNIFIKEMK